MCFYSRVFCGITCSPLRSQALVMGGEKHILDSRGTSIRVLLWMNAFIVGMLAGHCYYYGSAEGLGAFGPNESLSLRCLHIVEPPTHRFSHSSTEGAARFAREDEEPPRLAITVVGSFYRRLKHDLD